MCERKDTKRIAETLVLSEETIYSHTKNLLRKLGVHSREEAIEAAEQLRRPIAGLADTEQWQAETSNEGEGEPRPTLERGRT